MIKRKELVKEKVEKKEELGPEPVKLKRNFNINALQDAVVEGKFIAKIDDEIVVARSRHGKTLLSVCQVKKINENGLVETWDLTSQQWFVFNLSEQLPPMKLFTTLCQGN